MSLDNLSLKWLYPDTTEGERRFLFLMDNPRYSYRYDPETAYDFVTGEDGPRPRPKACYFPDRPIFPRLEATFDGDRPILSLWQRFLDWWVG